MNAYDLYTFYLEPRDLQEKAHQVKVERVEVKEVFNSRTKGKENKIILRFAGKKKALALNKTQAGLMIEITGTPVIEKWVGASVVIVPGRAPNGKDTIVITTEAKSGDLDLVEQSKTPSKVYTTKADAGTPEDVIAAFSDLCKRAGLDQETRTAILRECGGDFEVAYKKVAKQYEAILN